MSNSLYVSAAGMLAEDARTDVIANNLANVRTAGFRKDFVSFRQRLLRSGAAGAAGRSAPGLAIDRTAWDREAGPAVVTGRALDLALQGPGWFAIRRDGQTRYTRAGDFQVNSAGHLATSDGRGEVLSVNGTPISVSGVSRFEINGRGEVVGPDGVLGTIAVLAFDDESRLEKAGDALFRDTGGPPPKAATATEVVFGALEQASVQPVREMTAMIAAMRAYEMNAEALRLQDEMLGRAANDVGRLQA